MKKHLTRVLGFEWNHANEALSRGVTARAHSVCARVATELPKLAMGMITPIDSNTFFFKVLLYSIPLLFIISC